MSIEKLSTNASLKQVMDKFEEISLQDFSNIDIVVKKELPIKVKEGQIVIISDSVNNVYLDSKDVTDVNLNDNDIYIEHGLEDNCSVKITIKDSSKNAYMYIRNVYRYKNNECKILDDVYLGVEDKWVKVLDSIYVIFENGKYNMEIIETRKNKGTYSLKIQSNERENYFNSMYVDCTMDSRGGYVIYSTQSKINFSSYSKMILVLTPILENGDVSIYLSVSDDNQSFNSYIVRDSIDVRSSDGEKITSTIDLSNVNSEHFFKIVFYGTSYSSQPACKCYIESIILHK